MGCSDVRLFSLVLGRLEVRCKGVGLDDPVSADERGHVPGWTVEVWNVPFGAEVLFEEVLARSEDLCLTATLYSTRYCEAAST